MSRAPAKTPTVIVASEFGWPCHLQLAAALRRRGVRVEQLSIGAPGRWRNTARRIDRLVFRRVRPTVEPVETIRELVDSLGPALLDVQAEDRVAADITAYAAESGLPVPRRTKADFDERDLYDKFAMSGHAEATGWAVPRTWFPDDVPTSWPVVVKTRLGNSGDGVRIVRDQDELDATVAEFARLGGPAYDQPVYCQEFVVGDLVKVGGIARDGAIVQHASYRSDVDPADPLGPSSRVRTLDDAELATRAGALLERLGYTGFFGIDCIREASGRLCFLELNSRVWGCWGATDRFGTDFASAYLYALGAGPAVPIAAAAPGDWTEVHSLKAGLRNFGMLWAMAAMAHRVLILLVGTP